MTAELEALRDIRGRGVDRSTVDALGKNLKAVKQSCCKRYRQMCA